MTSALRSVVPNRRRRVRHKIQTPAYATFSAEPQGAMLDLHEIVDISEEGLAIQCHVPLEADRQVKLCLDLAECEENIFTAGQVIWTNGSGRAGIRFAALAPASLSRLREWLFLNAMAGVANSEALTDLNIPDLHTTDLHTDLPTADSASVVTIGAETIPVRPDYTETLTAVSAVQREVEALGRDLAAALQLIAARAQTLVRASGSAIALATEDSNFMDCRASAGPAAPPVGARLQVGSGFSGECVRSGRLLRCDDTDLDDRVDAESCRALGIRSILAAPVRVGEKSIGILETFSAQPNAFSEADSRALQRLAETVLAAVNRAARAEDLPTLDDVPAKPQITSSSGSVLFAAPMLARKAEKPSEKQGITLPLSHLVILFCFAATICLVLGYTFAPWIHARLVERGQSHLQTVLASSPAPKPAISSAVSVEAATIDQLRQMAEAGNPKAENELGLRYFLGDGIRQDEPQAFHWFSSAAEHGNLAAQSRLGFLYWNGRGVPKDLNKAYFWAVLARIRGDKGNSELAALLASGMTRAQVAAIEEQAGAWLRKQPTNLNTDH